MLIDFFRAVRLAGVPATIREFIDLLSALEQRLVFADLEAFYALAQLTLVKDEKYYDKFDRAFTAYFSGVAQLELSIDDFDIPEDWLRKQLERSFTPEEMAKIQSQGDLAELIGKFKERLREQQERHQGGNKWIGTGGTSPFGAFGYNPEGFRINQGESRHRRAIKVWEERRFRDLDDNVMLDVRQFQVALRRLRVFAREGATETLDMPETISSTAKNAGYLDLQMTRERRNAVKVLLLFDIGGSMDDHIHFCEALFTAARGEFKHLEAYYFHNCVYENLWRENARRRDNVTPTMEVLNQYGNDYRLILVGDASMSPYEVTYKGGSVEHFNEESGAVWLQRLTDQFPHHVWLNPVPEVHWSFTHSIGLIQQLMGGQMYPLTAAGADDAMRKLL